MEQYRHTACEAAKHLRELHGPGDGAELIGLPPSRLKAAPRHWLSDAADKAGHPLDRIDLAFALKQLPQRSSAVEAIVRRLCEGADICLVCHCGTGEMDEHGTMRQWRGDRCHLREEATLLRDRARARDQQAASRKTEADASAEARLREREAQFHQAQQAA